MQKFSLTTLSSLPASTVATTLEREPITLQDNGHDIAVLISPQDYQKNLRKQHSKKQTQYSKMLNHLKKRKNPILDPTIPYERTIIERTEQDTPYDITST